MDSMRGMRLLLLFACSCAAFGDNLRIILLGDTFKERVSVNATNFECAPVDTSNNVNIMCPKEKDGALGLLRSDEDGLIIRQASPEYARHIFLYDGGDILAYYFVVVYILVKCALATSAVASCTFLVYSEKVVLLDFVSKITDSYTCMHCNLTSNFTGILAQLVNCTLKFETLETVRNAKLRFIVPSINASTLIDVLIDLSGLAEDTGYGVTVIILIVFIVLFFIAFCILFLAVLHILRCRYRLVGMSESQGTNVENADSELALVAKATDQEDVSESHGASVDNPGEVLSQNTKNEYEVSEEVSYDLREDPDSENGEVDLGDCDSIVTTKKENTESKIEELPVDDVDNLNSEDKDIQFQ